MRLYLENVDKPHKQMQSDAAKAVPMICALGNQAKLSNWA
jgi:hypothetical protein